MKTDESERLAIQLERALNGEAWHGPSWNELLEGVDREAAIRRPLEGVHTIAELVLHTVTWQDAVRKRLESETPDIPESENWPQAELPDEAAWERVYELIAGELQHLLYHAGQAALCASTCRRDPLPVPCGVARSLEAPRRRPMSEHAARIAWSRGSAAFDYDSFSRDHAWTFPDGVTVPASSAPAFRGGEEAVDPEEALVAAAAACHMLTFLAIAARKKIVVDAYEDDAVGLLEKNDEGRLAVTRITLRPRVTFADPETVSAEALATLHEGAHRNCFIANSLRSEVTVETVENAL